MTFRFAHPLALALLALPVLFMLPQIRTRLLAVRLLTYSDTRLIGDLQQTWRVQLRRLPDVLRLLAWVMLVLALARPQSGRTQQIIRGEGIQIALALDISSSMEALDFAPLNRLDAAKQVIGSFIAGREFDSIGLTVFAQDAYQSVPPTLDYDVLLSSLGEVRLAPELGIDDGTAIGSGLASAANMLRSSSAPSRIVILLTDGVNTAGAIEPTTAAQAVATLGIRVYTIGMGKSGLVPVPDENGNPIMVESVLDEDTLQAIASITQGQYFRAEDLTSLEQVYNQIDVLERSPVERQIFVRWRERAGAIMFTGLIILIIERVLRLSVFQTIP